MKKALIITVSVISLVVLIGYIAFPSTTPEFKDGEYLIFKSEESKGKLIELYEEVLSEWPVAYRQTEVATSWGKTHILVTGEKNKKPLMLLNGGGGASPLFIESIKDLSRDHRVYTVDTIGAPGKSTLTRLPEIPQDYARWLNEVFTSLKIEKAAVVGVSYGAFISQWFYNEFPEKVDKIVLLSYSYKDQSMDIAMVFDLFYYSLFAGTQQSIEWLNGGPVKDKKKLKTYLRVWRLLNDHGKPFMIEPLNVPDDAVKKIAVPVLIIMGEKDPIWSAPKAREYLKKINNPLIRFEMIRGEGHMVPNTRAALVDKKILEFLN
ncbi:MAG: alpha/beta hydrolase [bacterium]|nr:alpha/beta hydrolase [bacterium]